MDIHYGHLSNIYTSVEIFSVVQHYITQYLHVLHAKLSIHGLRYGKIITCQWKYITVIYRTFNRPLKVVESFNTIEHNLCIFYMQKPLIRTRYLMSWAFTNWDMEKLLLVNWNTLRSFIELLIARWKLLSRSTHYRTQSLHFLHAKTFNQNHT